MINLVILDGRLTKDPQKIANKQSEGYWCTFSLAVSETAEKSSFFNCKAFKTAAEELCKNCHKGDRVIITDGRLTQDTYTTQDGQKHSEVRIIASRIVAIPKSGSQAQPKAATAESNPTTSISADDDPDMPF